MVSIEKLKKANELSKELKKHGFANDNGDAYSQAEQIVDRKQKSPEIEFPDGEQVLVQEPQHAESIEELRSEVHKLEKAREFSERKLYQHQEELSNLIDKMNEMIKSINLIELNQVNFEKKLLSNKSPPQKPLSAVETPTESTPKPVEQPPVQEQVQEVPAEVPSADKNEPVDKSGYAPADVAVDKIFYFGNK